MVKTKEILTLTVEIGDAMLRNGAEIYRIEDSLARILKAYDIKNFDVYVLSNGIFASANEGLDDACSVIRHTPLGDVNLGKISALNQLTRDICCKNCDVETAWKRLDECLNIPSPKKSYLIFFCGLGCACFGYLYGGSLIDSFMAFLAGMVLKWFLMVCEKRKYSRFTKNVFSSMIATFLSLIPLYVNLPVSQDKIVIGIIMPLVPGMTFTTSIRDFYNGDYLCGAIHLIDALLTALCIAAGVGIVISIYQQTPGGMSLL
ncbi:Uncharacterized membrane protein YjjP, DUF1212 family [Lachnospiraceae bacterium C7]|nr:Uncharacterized membrane protein YjjP, DUF1212 family [Lachnospiraceae bacterium C7]